VLKLISGGAGKGHICGGKRSTFVFTLSL